MINVTDKHNCCGCEACVQACPKQCISFEQDSEGFRYPNVDESLCIACGACERTCPILSPYDNRQPLSQKAAVNPDLAIRKQSSSGGIFSMLAERIIQEGGVVFGVRFDENWQAVFDYTESIDGLTAFRGSKYVQARVVDAYMSVKNFLKEGRKVLFTGTSCQVAALRHFLHRDYDNLLLVDIICHGVPSPKVWGRYLDEVTHNAVRAISDVQFRNKRQGWKRFNFDMTYDSQGEAVNISSWHQQNHFMRIFLQDAILRPSCHTCKAKAGSSGSDLTIADFWGIDKINPSLDDDQGTSLVLVYTSKGAQNLNALGLETWEAKYEDVVRFNPSIEISKPEHPKRSEFFAKLDSTDSVVNLIDETLRLPLSVRIKRLPRAMAYRLYHILKKALGGGNYEHSKGQEITNSLGQAEFVIAHPVVSDFTFRSKKNGWKQYRMEVKIGLLTSFAYYKKMGYKVPED